MYDLNGICGLTGLLARVAAVLPEPLRIAQTMGMKAHNSLTLQNVFWRIICGLVHVSGSI